MTQAEDDEISRKIANQAVRQLLKQPTVVNVEIIIHHLDDSQSVVSGHFSEARTEEG